jgi:hypothetical protein
MLSVRGVESQGLLNPAKVLPTGRAAAKVASERRGIGGAWI